MEAYLPSTGLLPKWLQWFRLGQDEARSLKLHLCLLCVCQGSNYLGHLHLLSQADRQGDTLEAKQPKLEIGTLIWDAGVRCGSLI